MQCPPLVLLPDELSMSTVAEKGHSNFQSCIFPNLVIRSEVVDFQNCIFLEIIYHDLAWTGAQTTGSAQASNLIASICCIKVLSSRYLVRRQLSLISV